MHLHFVRHGESEANLLGEFSIGLGKHPLTEKGRQQALELAQRLKGLPIAACYSSPILRAVQTAEIISTALGLTYQIAEALREFDVGILEGRSDEASWQQYSQLGNAWLAQREWEQRIEGGESFLDIRQRFVPFIENLVQQYGASESHILLVGHGGTYRCMLPLILNNVDFAFSSRHDLPNTAMVSAESTPQGLMCLQWGEEKFLVSVELHDRKVYGWLMGQGEPLVIMDAGMGDCSETWSNIQQAVAGFTRVLSYDRAGMGRSDKAPTPRTCQDIASDLSALLSAASLQPPYVLVAHSWSGLNARWFASQYPDEVVGMVLIDAVHEGKYDRFAQVMTEERTQQMWASVKDPSKNDEYIDRMASIAQVTSTQRSYNFPLAVLTRAADGDALSQIEIDLQREFLQLSTHSWQIFSTSSDHFIQTAQPELVIEAIRKVVELTRG